MNFSTSPSQRLLLFYCSFTCIYLPAILILLYLNDHWYNVGSYKFSPVLLILTFAEIIKLCFSKLQTNQIILESHNRVSSKKKPWTKPAKDFIKFLFVAVLLTTIYFIVIVLFGAPLLTHHEETTMLAVTLTTLTFIPGSLYLGVNDSLSVLIGSQTLNNSLFVEAVRTSVKATIFGTWLGAVVIPLDWDRPWQEWPIPCVTGALVGYTVGHFITLIRSLPFFNKQNKKCFQ